MLARRRRRPLRAQPLIHLVPNIFTVMSLCAGLTAIRYGLDQRYELALTLIVVAGVLDGLDGRSARLLKITSKLGAQLDSLADFLSFGVAPAVLVYLWTLNQVKGIGWSLALLFATCCALRLARFNTELEGDQHPPWMSRFFTGLPAPAAAGCLIMPMLATFALGQTWPRNWELNALLTLVVAVLMVSRVPTFSIKMIVVRVKPEWILPTLIGVGLLAAALLNTPWLTLLAVGVAYLVSLPVSVVVAYRLRRQHERESAAAASPGAQPESRAERIVRLGAGAKPQQRDAS
ncbi:MAG TPA: CDP-diacylglycerol--serine O-phosphatidyltransferase [Geminicoccaceae bacterium]|nr:CDP-diacylglycerol--serine O-phosphatidyltransferase [Geminicoccaceae bacterium]